MNTTEASDRKYGQQGKTVRQLIGKVAGNAAHGNQTASDAAKEELIEVKEDAATRRQIERTATEHD
jgi:hypothetical protein